MATWLGWLKWCAVAYTSLGALLLVMSLWHLLGFDQVLIALLLVISGIMTTTSMFLNDRARRTHD